MSSGSEGCNCIDQTSVLASLKNRDCTTATGKPGIYLKLGGSCVPYDYGSNACLQHDLLHDPVCQGDLSTAVIPPYCFQPWCYVDATSCRKNSEEDIFKSEYFLVQHDIFWSYSTCNSTDNFWQQYLESSASNVSVIGGTNITAIIPDYQYPTLNKRLRNGTVLNHQYERGDEYFDDSIPFGGIYIDYMNELVKISNGDIQNVTFTHTSKASLKRYPASSFTAAVQDVENGLMDMAVGPFWITGQRLKMTTYTVPLVYDKTVLVIPKPAGRISVADETKKVLKPFTSGLWAVVAAIIVAASLLSVWFSDREMAAKKQYGLQLKKSPGKRRKFAYFRLIVDAILEKGMFFFSAGIEQDMGASLPHKVLMFGFGFFILIAVSAYVAELAAFLTRSGLKTEYGTMKQVVDEHVPICGHPALKDELELKWPDATWVWHSDGFDAMFEAYARGECKVLAIGREDTIMNKDYLKRVCEHKLVYTDILITENPIAFPIAPQLASAFSYWMYVAEKEHGLSLENVKQAFIEKNKIKAECEVELSNLDAVSEDDFLSVSPSNMFLPIIFFVACAVIAAVLQLRHDSERKKGRNSTFGRKSTLEMYEIRRRTVEKCDGDEKEVRDADVQRKDSLLSLDEKVEEYDCATKTKSDTVAYNGNDVERGQICDFPGANVPGDEFHENGAPQSTLIEDVDMVNEDADTAVKVEDNGISHRIEELVESGVIEEVLDCFDFFQEMKKLKKDQ